MDNALSLEDLIFSELRKYWPDIFGHVQEVHKDSWLAVYVYLPPGSEKMTTDEFSKVIIFTDRILKNTQFAESICRYEQSVGRDSQGIFHYIFWLPMCQRTPGDFKLFFPD